MSLDKITKCRMCNSPNLTLYPEYSYETVHFNDIEEKEVIGVVLKCECGCLHFLEEDRLCCQKNHVEVQYNFVGMIPDNEKHLQI
jgi:hypothetical protein